MRIQQLLRLLEAYLSSRANILREVEDRGITTADLASILNVGVGVVALRRRNPDHWRPEEIKQLANEFGMATNAPRNLKQLSLWIEELPKAIRMQLLKEARITKDTFVTRYSNYNSWHYTELEQLACTLRLWQDTKKLDALLKQSSLEASRELAFSA